MGRTAHSAGLGDLAKGEPGLARSCGQPGRSRLTARFPGIEDFPPKPCKVEVSAATGSQQRPKRPGQVATRPRDRCQL
jgi:hypothetical protein